MWKWGKNGKLTVKSTYNALTESNNGTYVKQIWRGKIPPKIKFFMWLLSNGAVLTKDNMLRRNWHGSSDCYFCELDESIDHLFFKCSVAKIVWACVATCFGARDIPGNLNQCWSWLDKWLPQGRKFHVIGTTAICWAIWKARKACFDKNIIRNPMEIIFHVGALMNFWAGLYPELDREALEEGVNMMLKVAIDILAAKKIKMSGADEDPQDNHNGGQHEK
jgi:hypothetical protein